MMIRKRMHAGPGSFFRIPAISVTAGALALLVGCGGDAESSDDMQGSAAAGGDRPVAATPAPPVRGLPSGTVLTFEVTENVSTSSHAAGDGFTLRLVSPAQGQGGLTLESGTEARGVVTDARPSRSNDEEALLAVRIESVRIDGRARALNGTVQSTEVRADSGDSGTRSAAKVATGAAAGAIIGQVLGRDTRSTVQGAAAGAVAGLGIALTTRDGHATLPVGSLVTVRLQDALVVN
jgi:hypothetical protein